MATAAGGAPAGGAPAGGTPARKPFNPFDSDVEDEALDPVSIHFGEEPEDNEDLVDFSGKLMKSKKKEKLKGPAQSVKVLDDEGSGDTEVIGQVWESSEAATTKPSVSKRWNYYQRSSHLDPEPPSGQSFPPTSNVRSDRAPKAPAPERDWTPMTIKATALRIVLGKPFVLEYYRRLEEKRQLLHEVVKLHDGNAILTVLLFLKRTLRENLFLAMLLEHRAAEDHYVSYLRQLGDMDLMEKFYAVFLRARQAGMLMYSRHCVRSPSSSARVKGLEKCIGYFSTFDEISHEIPHLKDELYLLKDIQIPLQRIGNDAEDSLVFVQFPRTMAVTSASLAATLFYACLYHFSAPEKEPWCPERIRKDFKLSEKQFLWMAVGARAKARDYKNIDERLLTVTGWFGRKNLKSAIGFEKVAEVLHQHRAPEDEVAKYLRKTDDLEIRLVMARKVDCPVVVIETLKEKRDRVALENYRDRLPMHSTHRRQAEQLLGNSTIRWRN